MVLPEKVLVAAVLRNAILEGLGVLIGAANNQRRPGSGKKLKQSARRWVRKWEVSDIETPFTFPWVCTSLGLCPLSLKKAINKFWLTRRKDEFLKDKTHDSLIVIAEFCSESTDAECNLKRIT